MTSLVLRENGWVKGSPQFECQLKEATTLGFSAHVVGSFTEDSSPPQEYFTAYKTLKRGPSGSLNLLSSLSLVHFGSFLDLLIVL